MSPNIMPDDAGAAEPAVNTTIGEADDSLAVRALAMAIGFGLLVTVPLLRAGYALIRLRPVVRTTFKQLWLESAK